VILTKSGPVRYGLDRRDQHPALRPHCR
jgi:hypothetical protein